MKTTLSVAFLFLLCGCGASTPTGVSKPAHVSRSFTLMSLLTISGERSFRLEPPYATGNLVLELSGRYTMDFGVPYVDWREHIVGRYTINGNDVQLVPDDSARTTTRPFLQTVIIGDMNIKIGSAVEMMFDIAPDFLVGYDDRIILIFWRD